LQVGIVRIAPEGGKGGFPKKKNLGAVSIPLLFPSFLSQLMKPLRPVDLKSIARKTMRAYGFEPLFPENVMKQADALDGKKPQMQKASVRDLTALPWSSIDNIDT